MNSEIAIERQPQLPAAQLARKKVLFVCLGNICRSPSAQGIFEYLLKQRDLAHKYEVDSAGTHEYHVGKAPDERAILAAKNVGVEIDELRGRQFGAEDFERFDHIFVMDRRNYEYVQRQYPDLDHAKVRPIISVLGESGLKGVPDPYHGKQRDFDDMIVKLTHVCEALINELEGL